MPRPVPFAPYSHLETERLRLRPYVAEDVDTYLFIRSAPEMNQHIAPEYMITVRQACLDKMMNLNSGTAAGKWLSWALTLHDSDTMVGSLGIWGFDWERGAAELTYALLPEHQGRGLMREAVQMVIGLAFNDLGLNVVEACTSFENVPSREMLTKLGFSSQGPVPDEPDLECWALPKP